VTSARLLEFFRAEFNVAMALTGCAQVSDIGPETLVAGLTEQSSVEMDLRQLKTFRVVTELGSLSKASDRLRIAQPALSRQIRLLEHELRTPLFVRHGRGMVPTEAGRLLFDRTSGLVRQLEQAQEDVLNVSSSPSGRVVVGMVPTIGSALALTVAQKVIDRLPGVTLRMVDAYASALIEAVHRREVDIAVIYGPAGHLHLDVETLGNDDLFAIGAIGSGLARSSSVSLEWLADQPLVMPSAPHALRLLVDAAYAKAGRDFTVRVEADSFQTLMGIVEGGMGMTFLPYYAVAREIESGRLEAARIQPVLRREVVLALPPPNQTSAAATIVAGIVRADVRRLLGTKPE